MKKLLFPLAMLTAAPALAHEGAHMHPHANDPAWGAILLALAVAGVAVLLVQGRK